MMLEIYDKLADISQERLIGMKKRSYRRKFGARLVGIGWIRRLKGGNDVLPSESLRGLREICKEQFIRDSCTRHPRIVRNVMSVGNTMRLCEGFKPCVAQFAGFHLNPMSSVPIINHTVHPWNWEQLWPE